MGADRLGDEARRLFGLLAAESHSYSANEQHGPVVHVDAGLAANKRGRIRTETCAVLLLELEPHFVLRQADIGGSAEALKGSMMKICRAGPGERLLFAGTLGHSETAQALIGSNKP